MKLSPTLHLRLLHSKRSDVEPPVLQQWFTAKVDGVIVMDTLCAEPGVFSGEWRDVKIAVE